MRKRKVNFPRLLVICLIAALSVFSFYSYFKVHEMSATLEQEHHQYSSAVANLQSKLAEANSAVSQAQRRLSNTAASQAKAKNSSSKVAYLTFDDGPSQYTNELLDTLKSNNVHATFFVVGTNVVNFQDVIKREHAEGNAVGIHCFSHDYAVCYASQAAFFDDFNHIKEVLTSLIGVSPNVCRFPGGTGNTVSDRYGAHFMRQILPQVTAMGIKPFDWDVDAGDADSVPASTQEVINTVIREAKVYNHPVILCHDIKKNTVKAIPSIIAQLKALGYSFNILSPNAPTCQERPV